MAYTIAVCTLGASETVLTNAVPAAPVENEINQPQSFSFSMDVLDAQTPLCLPIEREIHVYRDATRIFAGPIMIADFDASSGLVTFGCDGLLAYMGQRNIDSGADRENHLLNPEGEDSPDLDDWTEVNTTATVTTDQHILGTKSFQLVQAASLQDAYLSQDVAVTGTGVGSLFTVVGWFKIDPDDWIGEAIGGRGLTLSRIDGFSVIQQSGDFFITGDTPRGSWQRAKATVWVPPNAAETLQVRLYSPGGTIWWDALSLTLMESLSSVEDVDDFFMDEATIAENVVLFVDDKDPLNITTDCPTTGVSRERHYQFADHTNALQALLEWSEMENGFDISLGPDRVFRTHYPFKGTDRTDAVTLAPPTALADGNCLLGRWRFDGDQAASGVVVLGAGDGPDREEGGAVDPAAFGGRVVEIVITPRATTAIDTLDEMASRELVDRSSPSMLELLVVNPTLVALLEAGDIVDVDVDYGSVQAAGDWRIVRTAEDLAAGTLAVTLRAMPGGS